MSIKGFYAVVFLSIIVLCGVSLKAEEAKPGKIEYIRENAPEVPFKPYDGQYYNELAPATFDISDRGHLAINALTGSTNPLADYELYWLVMFSRNPVVMYHDLNDWCGLKFMEALPLLRMATGSKHMLEVDRVWQEVTLKSIGPDGLYYIPMKGRPWALKGNMWPGGIVHSDGSVSKEASPDITQFTHPYVNGRIMSTMVIYYLRDNNPVWKKTIGKMIDRLLELAVHKEDYCYFPNLYYEPNAKMDKLDSSYLKEPKQIEGGELNGRIMHAAAQYYKISGYEPAKELAKKQINYMRHHSDYWTEDGKFLGTYKHFHAHTIYMLGMLEYAIAVEDKELLNWVRKSYEWAKSPEAGASSLIGFFPEWAKPDFTTCESCEIADMIALALKFSSAGVKDYYEDAERWTRNHFAESQLTKTDWVSCYADKRPESEVKSNETATNTLKRNIGSFAGWSTASDWWVPFSNDCWGEESAGIMHCCTGNAARSIYYIWQDILGYKDGQLKVNMLLNRASSEADVHSHIPYQGQVDIKIKKDCKGVLVHAPEWIKTGSDEIKVTVDGKSRKFKWQARYIDIGKAKQGSKIEIKFPISERKVKEKIGNVDYALVVKGNTVVFIHPSGKNGPLYQRDHLRDNNTHWKQVDRFVPAKQIKY